MIDRLNDILAGSGLFVRGGFHPANTDSVPDLPDGAIPGTVVLIGNAGAPLWQAFRDGADLTQRHPLDAWLKPLIEEAAHAVGAHPVFPNHGPPFVPLQDWAVRAEPVFRSPIGIMIHPQFGLWHVYRAALLFAERLDLPDRADTPNPCDACEKRPCLAVCPADAFLPDRFDAASCVSHVDSPAGANCRERGCLARRACPVGRDYTYLPDQQEFHTAAMVRAVKSGYGGTAT